MAVGRRSGFSPGRPTIGRRRWARGRTTVSPRSWAGLAVEDATGGDRRQQRASIFISASGKEFLPIGGFTGSIPEPTIDQLEGMIRAGKFHLVLLTGGHDPRLTWIAHHCQHLGPGVGTVGVFTCRPADVPASGG
jgi:hypothetical protein